MRIVLEIVEGAAAGRKKALRAPLVMTVGRSDAADWMVSEDSAMSSIHFQVSVSGDGCVVTDLDSTNGTMVDGQRISSQELTDGDRITAGTTVFRLSMTQRSKNSPLISGRDTEPSPSGNPPVVDSEPQTPSTPPIQTASQDPVSVADGMRQTKIVGASNAAFDGTGNQSVRDGVGERAVGYEIHSSRSRPFSGAVIEVVSEHAQGRKSILRSGQSVTIGRTEQADFVIADPLLSATHFTLASTRSGWQLTDLGSTAGTMVGGTRVAKTILKTGDQVTAGQTRFIVTIGESVPTGMQGAETAFPFQQGVRDEDPAVRRAALEAAAWSGEPWLLDFCRQCAMAPTIGQKDTLSIFAVLALPNDLDLILKLGRCLELETLRFDLLASFGHPSVVPSILDAIQGDDPNAAVAAGHAFTRITGVDIASTQRVVLDPEQANEDEYEREFADDGFLPDSNKASTTWQKLSQQFNAATNVRQGIDTSHFPPQEVLDRLDRKSRWELCLRGRYDGTWTGNPFELERFSLHELL